MRLGKDHCEDDVSLTLLGEGMLVSGLKKMMMTDMLSAADRRPDAILGIATMVIFPLAPHSFSNLNYFP